MLFLKKKDLKRRNSYKKNEILKSINKFLFINLLNSDKYLKKDKSKFLRAMIKKTKESKTKIVLRCSITNRSRGNFRPFNISRFLLRDMIHLGIVPGFSKAVW